MSMHRPSTKAEKARKRKLDQASRAKRLSDPKYRKAYAARIRKSVNALHYRLRQKLLDRFGRKCKCCGEAEEMFLTLDHKNGCEERVSIRRRRPYAEYRAALVDPDKSKYQILCFNCNSGRQRNGGVCPHRG